MHHAQVLNSIVIPQSFLSSIAILVVFSLQSAHHFLSLYRSGGSMVNSEGQWAQVQAGEAQVKGSTATVRDLSHKSGYQPSGIDTEADSHHHHHHSNKKRHRKHRSGGFSCTIIPITSLTTIYLDAHYIVLTFSSN